MSVPPYGNVKLFTMLQNGEELTCDHHELEYLILFLHSQQRVEALVEGLIYGASICIKFW